MILDQRITREYHSNFLLKKEVLRDITEVLESYRTELAGATSLVFYISKNERRGSVDAYTRDLKEVLAENHRGQEIAKLDISIEAILDWNGTMRTGLDVRRRLASVTFSSEEEKRVRVVVFGVDSAWRLRLLEDLDRQIRRAFCFGKFFRPLRASWVNLALLFLLTTAAVAVPRSGVQAPSRLQQSQIPDMSREELVEYVDELAAASESREGSKSTAGSTRSTTSVLQATEIPAALGLYLVAVVVVAGTRPLSGLATLLDKSVFYWGDNAGSHDARRRLLANLFWILVVGFIVSLAASLLSQRA